MTQRLWVPGPLPGLNEALAAARLKRGPKATAYSKLKASWTNTVALLAKAARLKPVERAHFRFEWRETSRIRNPDNVAMAKKFCLDGLVEAGVLSNDGWGQVLGWTDTFVVSPKPGVLVTITPPDSLA